MSNLTNEALCTKGFDVLEEHLGPVETMRFLSLINPKPFDYQKWRTEHFGKMSVDDVLGKIKSKRKTDEQTKH